MTTKVRVSVGTTLNLGNYNSARVTVEIENEARESILEPESLQKTVEQVTEKIYTLAEQELVDKIARLIDRLEREGFLPDGG